MSIIHQSNNCNLIDHSEYISNLYKNVVIDTEVIISCTLPAKLFSIVREQNKSRKRTYDCDEFHEETTRVKNVYQDFIEHLPIEIKEQVSKKYKVLDTSSVRDFSKKLFESAIFDHSGVNGGNNSETSLKCKIKNDYFFIPSKCRFFCGNISDISKLHGSKFDVLIADPPWWNKYIRRLKNANDKLSYSMMYNEDIAAIPVKSLLSNNCLVAVWCTNAPSNISAVKDLIFPKWGIEYTATWYWVKVTADLEPICDFGAGSKKQPYERIILGTTGSVKEIPNEKFILSVPSALHSHKPPLLDLLSPYLITEKPETLELFARYLLPNTTSVGYEPLKWQHESLYEIIS